MTGRPPRSSPVLTEPRAGVPTAARRPDCDARRAARCAKRDTTSRLARFHAAVGHGSPLTRPVLRHKDPRRPAYPGRPRHPVFPPGESRAVNEGLLAEVSPAGPLGAPARRESRLVIPGSVTERPAHVGRPLAGVPRKQR